MWFCKVLPALLLSKNHQIICYTIKLNWFTFCPLSVHGNKQAGSCSPWDTQGLAGCYTPAFRSISWEGPPLLQRAGPADPPALFVLSQGGSSTGFGCARDGPRHPTETRGEEQKVYGWSAFVACHALISLLTSFPVCLFTDHWNNPKKISWSKIVSGQLCFFMVVFFFFSCSTNLERKNINRTIIPNNKRQKT